MNRLSRHEMAVTHHYYDARECHNMRTEDSVNLTLEGVPPFFEPVTFRFSEKVNVLAGPNGCGKSTALARLAGKPFPRWYSELANTSNHRVAIDPPDFLSGKPTVYIASTRTELDSKAVSNYIAQAKQDSFFWSCPIRAKHLIAVPFSDFLLHDFCGPAHVRVNN